MQVLDIKRILSIEYFIVCYFSTRILELNIRRILPSVVSFANL
jgi:hypothetical protein